MQKVILIDRHIRVNMRKTLINKIFLIFLLLPCLHGCLGPKSVNGITVSELLITVSNERHGIDYCRLLKKATNGDPGSIKKLTLLNFYDGTAYDHGGVIVDLMKMVGEDKFIQSFEELDSVRKQLIKGYIECGMEYGSDPSLQDASIEEAFPKVYISLHQ